MKQIVLGDTHGRTLWKEAIKQDFDRLIFIGDYVDTHDNITGLEQLENLREIINYKETSGKEVILLIGNHDYHYFPEIGYTGTSGYQAGMAKSFEFEFGNHRDLFQMVFVDENENLFSHAGVTETWLNDVGINIPDIYSLVDVVNDLWKYKPRKFDFYPNDTSWCGDNVHQSCIWVRPNSLYRDGINKTQIVGHTTQNSINPRKSERQGYYLIDTLGTSQEYLTITNGVVEISKIAEPPKLGTIIEQ